MLGCVTVLEGADTVTGVVALSLSRLQKLAEAQAVTKETWAAQQGIIQALQCQLLLWSGLTIARNKSPGEQMRQVASATTV